MTKRSSEHGDDSLPFRHTVAKWSSKLSLRARLLSIVGLVVAAIVGGLAFLEVRSFERAVEQDLTQTARLTAQAVADDLQSRRSALDPGEIRDTLHDFAGADPAVRQITVMRAGPVGPEIVATTSSEERSTVVTMAGRALERAATVEERDPSFLSVAVPFTLSGTPFCVVSTISMAGVQQAGVRGRVIALGFAVPVIVLVTIFVDVTTRFLVHRPLAEIRGAITRATGGDLRVRAKVTRQDELGTVAAGLNGMLDRIESFNEILQNRVHEATGQLELRNAQLEDSYRQLLALRDALARAERMSALGQMAATVAHQVGTPLNLVSGYVQMIRDDPQVDARNRERLDIMMAQVDRVTSVLRTLLDQARQPPTRQTTSLHEIVERVCELAGPRLSTSGIRLQLSLPGTLPSVDVDAVQFELVFLNLISNAIDAMPQGGTLTIRAAAAEDNLRVEVADTGTGIPPSGLDRIFDPWVSAKPAGRGTGLGLGIVRDVVQAHGGRVSAQNNPAGGAVFTIDLPRAAA